MSKAPRGWGWAVRDLPPREAVHEGDAVPVLRGAAEHEVGQGERVRDVDVGVRRGERHGGGGAGERRGTLWRGGRP